MLLLGVKHRQQQEADCLVACSAMVLDYLGITIDYRRLFRLLKTTEAGAYFSNITLLTSLGLFVETGKQADLSILKWAGKSKIGSMRSLGWRHHKHHPGKLVLFDIFLNHQYNVNMANDIIHDAVRNALVKDGWQILHEHFRIEYEEIEIFADLIIERLPTVAVKDSNKIIIEVKSFAGRSFVRELQQAIGQYELYLDMIELAGFDYELFLAVSSFVYETLLQRKATRQIIQRHRLKLVIIDTDGEEVVQWLR